MLQTGINNDSLIVDLATDYEDAKPRSFECGNLFFPVVERLRSEGLHELSTSVLCYYLFVSAVAAKGDLDDMNHPSLGPVIMASRGLPGWPHMRRTLEIICALAGESGHEITRLLFAQYLRPPHEQTLELIQRGESDTCEFKSTLRTNLYTRKRDREMEHAALKTVAAFLNSRGGNLLIGVNDDGEVLGLDADNFQNPDKLKLHFKNLLKQTMPDAVDQVTYDIVTVGGKSVLLVECTRGRKPALLKNRNSGDEEFYVRRGPSTDRLGLRETLEYIQRIFQDEAIGSAG